ncbi:DJ-1/PfpI family protein [Halostella sp. JP-L12]|uniref:DJ-1/PfpI family protein n=1 Tax=Halostella TaxID=1843185 RepID=UPI000EF84AF6|nr:MULTISPECIES: DJ-1/PfpI family protein [Halostella]NHN49662.1 DJ-1/PfpI family protein [Halostella sp. JP-L12]
MRDVSILLFDGFDELDAIAPYEVFSMADEMEGAFDVSYVSCEVVDTVTASHGTKLVVDSVLDDPDLLIVPGGGWNDGGGVRREVDDGLVPDEIAKCHEAGATVASVCTGAMLLTAAGLLDDRPATTHHAARADLREYATLQEARVVDTGGVITAGGITSGIDLSLWLVERFRDYELSTEVASELEHDRSDDIVQVEIER